tara:strand:- start:985 stop:1509 length:525 start_codon:yes stop_codon:yes gene_type:complete
MDRQIITISFRFIGLVLLQILILNNIQFSSILNPFLYVYFLIALPVDFRPSLALLLGFLLGLTIDIFCQTLGIHTIAATFAAFCRPYILLYMAPRDGYEFSRIPSVRQMGWLWFTTYSGLLVLMHHLTLFLVEMFRMSGLMNTIGKTFGSTLLTLILVLITQLIFIKRSGSAYE